VRRFANGYVEVTGRVKDVIHRSGETVSALDLETHLLAHPAIWAAAAVGIADQLLGEKICAAVVLVGPALTLAELNEYLDGRGLSAHARPDMLVPLPSLPTTAVGKVDKRTIAAQLGSPSNGARGDGGEGGTVDAVARTVLRSRIKDDVTRGIPT
jgi:mycobactin salicyl-AMP ligase